ncbi:MAG TPA: Bax inhibitor-1 family protein, partial [Candidatus Methylomirabilis sp.]|nr:Bax inhibitor-1 family protein [Candidatus Methylomirabilis sp.]
MGLGDMVWDRENSRVADSMSDTAYIASVSGFTIYGLILSSVLAYFTMGWHPGWIAFIGIGLVMPLFGIFIAMKSDEFIISFLGHTMVCAGLGAVLGPTIAMFSTGVVVTAIWATAGVTIVTSIVGIVYPKSLEHWGIWLFGALTALLFVRIAQIFMISMGVSEKLWYMPWIEYGAAVLFSLYIIYDWNRAMRLPHTLDNAVDCAMAIYLDVVNLFVTLLR